MNYELLWSDPDIDLWRDFEILFKVKTSVTPPPTQVQAKANTSVEPRQVYKTLKTIKQGEIIGARLVQKEVEQTRSISTVQITEREVVTEEAMNEVIRDLLGKITDQKLFHAAIKNANITLDGETINIGVISKADLQMLSPVFKEWLKSGLRAGLHNSYIEVNYLKQDLPESAKVQTETEMLRELLSTSSVFRYLVDELDLVIDA